MTSMQLLRAFVSHRMTVAVEEIIGMFERAIAEYEQEMDGQRRKLLLLRAEPPLQPPPSRGDAGSPQNIQPLLTSAKMPAEQQGRSPRPDQEDPDPPHIKEEQEDVWSPPEAEQPRGPAEADAAGSQLPPVNVKTEGEEENPPSSPPQRRHAEERREAEPPACGSGEQTAAEDCRGPEPAFDLDVAGFLKAASNGQFFLSQCFRDDTDGADGEPPGKGGGGGGGGSDALRSRDGQKKPYKCPACGKPFQHNKDLQRHLTCHTGERPFDCPECGKKFSQKGSLDRHMRIHTGERPFRCGVCGKNFTQSGTLAIHMRTHTGEKPFSCSVCKKSYNERRTLGRHMRVHTGERPFACTLCGKRFSEKGNLNKHRRIHTGERPFSCSVCERSFCQLSHLKIHKCPGGGGGGGESAEPAVHLRFPEVTVQLSRHLL